MRILLVALLLMSASGSFAQGFLKAEGKYIVNENGHKVILRGMGLGGWMLQEGYMFHVSNLGRQYRIREKIQEVVGAAKTQQFYEAWLANHTTKADIDSMARWGFNSIRLPMHYNLYTLPVDQEPVAGQQTWLSKGFAMTDSLLKWCGDNRIYLILDLHATPGGQGSDLAISDRDPAKPSLWESEANQQKTVALWRKLAERYANEPWIGAYDIINEPNWGFEYPKDTRGTAEKKNEPLRKLMVDITKAIREVDTKHLVIIEGNGFGNNYRGIMPAWDNNMALSFHKYGNFNTVNSIQGFLSLRDQYQVPIWLGESGENSNTWFTEAIQLAESNEIGWAWWQNKKMGINNPLEIKVPKDYQLLLNYWADKGPKPTEAEAWKILTELLENLKLKNNIYHPDVTDAMFRQIQSTTTIPFRNSITINGNTIIPAVDFDMGRQRYAYYDKDSARYQYTPGVNTHGNGGNTYRNDGVDIKADSAGPYVYDIADDEWLQYTVVVPKAGKYDVSFSVSATSDTGMLSLLVNEQPLVKEIPVPNTGGLPVKQYTVPQYLYLKKGAYPLRIYARKGGFVLHHLRFVRRK